jgi:hypothetical protein
MVSLAKLRGIRQRIEKKYKKHRVRKISVAYSPFINSVDRFLKILGFFHNF